MAGIRVFVTGENWRYFNRYRRSIKEKW
jgi:hypothetical protein